MAPEMSPFIPIALFYLICAIISLIGNGIMIICFFKEHDFKTPCHYLITLTCAADMLHLCGHFVFNFQLFYQGPGTQELCFWLLLPTSIGHCISSPLFLSMGIDRFLACRMPLFYRTNCAPSSKYLLLQLCFPVIFTTFFNVFSYIQRNPNILVVCQIPLAMSGRSIDDLNHAVLAINIIVLIVYCKTYFRLKKTTGKSHRMKVVFKSIFCTAILVLTGWSTVSIGTIAGLHLFSDIETQRIVCSYAGICLNVACASNVFVFYAINSEYRAAIRRLFRMNTVCVQHTHVRCLALHYSKNKIDVMHRAVFLEVHGHSTTPCSEGAHSH